ncbi:hypothetical protein OIU34_19650 [Pararhizobium sp. BT-229]|uniref:hypothetical protein n=1 Tax=Pararhizobium sp. BT-229 TaxID=2986923 RepID=UPI0021F74FD1|nr:hypothetical protein [Pararhizobium sp. BT-229]MCV9964100.1 hypothetical protein [Pararhizobium sp. BT-229]
MTLRIINGKEKQLLLDETGGCQTCGFCEPGLIAWQARGAAPAVSCEECLENLHPSDSPRFVAAYLPELDLAAVSHYVRVSAFFAFATKTFGHGVYTDDGGLVPHAFASPGMWKGPLKYRSKRELEADAKVLPRRLRAADQAVSSYAFLLERIETARSLFGSASPAAILTEVGESKFRASCRVIPLSIPMSRIRTWGHPECSFMTLGFGAESPTVGSRRIASALNLNLDDVFDERDDIMARGA